MKNIINNIKDNFLYIIAFFAFMATIGFGVMATTDFEIGIIGMITCGFLTIVELVVQGICEIKLDIMDYIDADHNDMLVDINNIVNPIVDDEDMDIPTIIRNNNK